MRAMESTMTDQQNHEAALIAAYRQGYREVAGEESDQDDQTVLDAIDTNLVTGIQGAHMLGRKAAIDDHGDERKAMPTAALRPCPEPGCSALVAHGRCPAHYQERNLRRTTFAARRWYRTVRWARLRRQVLVEMRPYMRPVRPGRARPRHRPHRPASWERRAVLGSGESSGTVPALSWAQNAAR